MNETQKTEFSREYLTRMDAELRAWFKAVLPAHVVAQFKALLAKARSVEAMHRAAQKNTEPASSSAGPSTPEAATTTPVGATTPAAVVAPPSPVSAKKAPETSKAANAAKAASQAVNASLPETATRTGVGGAEGVDAIGARLSAWFKAMTAKPTPAAPPPREATKEECAKPHPLLAILEVVVAAFGALNVTPEVAAGQT